MSSLSELTITLNKPSQDYFKIILVSYGITMLIVLFSQFSWVLLILFESILLLQLFRKLSHSKPIQQGQQLVYQQHWQLYMNDGNILHYERARIGCDATFFLMLILIKDKKRHHLLLFRDQMNAIEWRKLKIMARHS